MKYLYLKLPDETVIMPTNQAYVCCRNDESIIVRHQLAGSGYTILDKLKARYPEEFSAEKSLHRKGGDI